MSWIFVNMIQIWYIPPNKTVWLPSSGNPIIPSICCKFESSDNVVFSNINSMFQYGCFLYFLLFDVPVPRKRKLEILLSNCWLVRRSHKPRTWLVNCCHYVPRSLTDFNHSNSLVFSGICSVTWTCLIWMSWNVSLTWCILTHPLRNISAVHQAPPSAGNHGLGMRSVVLIITLQCTLCTLCECCMQICECCMQSVIFDFHWLQNKRSGKSHTRLWVQGGFRLLGLCKLSVFILPSTHWLTCSTQPPMKYFRVY